MIKNKGSFWWIFPIVFFSWGINIVINVELRGLLETEFSIGYSISSLINLIFYSSYLLTAFIAGILIKRWSYKTTLIIGNCLMVVGSFLSFISIQINSFPCFLTGVFFTAMGITFMQVAANLYVLLSTAPQKAVARLTLFQSFNALGPFLAALAGQVLRDLIISRSDLHLIKIPYLAIVILMLLILAVLIYIPVPDIPTNHLQPENKIASLRKRHVMHFPQLRLGAFAIFAYVGAQTAMGSYLTMMDSDKTIYYWGLALAGRFVGSFLLLKYDPHKMVSIYASTNGLIVLLIMMFSGTPLYVLMVLMGFFNSILFPTIYALSVKGLGKFSIDGSVVLIMFISGGSLVSFNFINFSAASPTLALIIPLICYIYIAFYGSKFSRYEKE